MVNSQPLNRGQYNVEVRTVNNIDDLNVIFGSSGFAKGYSLAPTQQLSWIGACYETLAANSRILVIYAQEGNEILAVAPVCRKKSIFSTYEQFGTRQLLEPTDFIYDDVDVLMLLTQKMAEMKMPLSLYRLPDSSNVPEALATSYKGRARIFNRTGKNYPYIDLTGRDLEKKLSSRLRQDIRRARRKAEKIGKVEFQIRSPSSKEEFLPLFNELVHIEAAGWKGRNRTALAFDAARREFFEKYGISASEMGMLRMPFMLINDSPVAAQFAIESGGAYWLYKIGYDEAFNKCSPGIQLIYETLRYAIDRKLIAYEFLGTPGQWTRRWTKTERKSHFVAVYPYSLGGIAASLGDLFRYVARVTSKKTPMDYIRAITKLMKSG